ncbi:hypothetical protein P171DRAFT_508378 [Karstenula rhodostoma CBS 690.94]|uniref:Uncharacterized protein n=1 Tax=Karstenula rhodostoma CBS 690.94 TaxID=1392251 RepID=A0A9P4PN76_9PLEO|nr:hypothetical protein P171DRAFT_508378 [Karstenula rhodostoma CBS 690.94]
MSVPQGRKPYIPIATYVKSLGAETNTASLPELTSFANSISAALIHLDRKDAELVFNCTGLGASKLCDENMFATRAAKPSSVPRRKTPFSAEPSDATYFICGTEGNNSWDSEPTTAISQSILELVKKVMVGWAGKDAQIEAMRDQLSTNKDMKRSRSRPPSQFAFAEDKSSMERHVDTDFTRHKRRARGSRHPTESNAQFDDPMEANQPQAMAATRRATTSSPNSIYRIHYDSLPHNCPGYVSIHEGSQVGYTNDSDLAKLAAEFSWNHHLSDKGWQVQEYKVGAYSEQRLKQMDKGPVELKNGSWATFYGRYNAIMATRDCPREKEKLEDELLAIHDRKYRPNHGTQDDAGVEKQPDDAVMEAQEEAT